MADKVEHTVLNEGPGEILIRRAGMVHFFLKAGQVYTGYVEAIEAGGSTRYSVKPVE